MAFRRLHPETRHGYARPISDVGAPKSSHPSGPPWAAAVPVVPALARAPVGPPNPPPLPNRTFLTDTMEEVGGVVGGGYQSAVVEDVVGMFFNFCYT